ncbi:hypothetical protein ACFO3K_03580 [Cellulomonas algicola]|uniref:Uncharacterized protein n=1 Tax=Cellulomonas algicola TaxID=2071633 RepID=A0A401UW80_9CELL|nr:hypothetical protein [Cellulomonas algicola]GCD18945.1 hypothetical protein CTKZ_05070 [Cellulomonas algicola]
MAFRFLRDGRLRLPSGVTLDRSPAWLLRAEAERLCDGADLVLHHVYPDTVDITRDRDLVRTLVSRVDSDEHLIYARHYTGDGLSVVTLDEHH